MADLIRTYIIPLRRAWLKTQRYKRAPKATRTVAIFIAKHMKSDDVRITPDLNHLLWEHGIKNPPGKIKVDAKKDDKGVCVVQVSGKPFPAAKEAKKEAGIASNVMDKLKGFGGKKPGKKVEAEVVKSEKKEEAKPAAARTSVTPAPKPAAKPAVPAQKPAAPATKPATPKPIVPAQKPAAPAQKPVTQPPVEQKPVPAKPAEEKKDALPLRLKK